MPRHKPGSVADLKERCATLRSSIRSLKLATEEELAAYWPGGAENTDRSRWGWIFAFATLVAFRRRAETTERDETIREAFFQSTIMEEPIEVSLKPDPVWVHPKSFEALTHLVARDQWIGWLAERMDEIRTVRDPRSMDTLTRAYGELARQYSYLSWCATYAGPGLPYDPFQDIPDPPAEILAWSTRDHAAVALAFMQVNTRGLELLPKLAGAASERISWGRLAASLGVEKGVPATHYLRNRSLPGLITELHLSAHSRQKAEAEAKARHEKGGVNAA